MNLWSEYELALFKLIGNYYALADRLDSICEKEPTAEILGFLQNTFKDKSKYAYFFQKLSLAIWLEPLYKAGYFLGNNNPEPLESELNTGFFSFPYWFVLEYLEKVAKNLVQNMIQKLLIF